MTRPTSFLSLIIALGMLLASDSHLHAQRSGELSYQAARRVGLTSVWSKSIATGYGGKISGVTVYVSPTKSYQASEVVDKYGRRVFFSDRDTGRPTSRAGYNQTTRLADLKKAELAARGLAPQTEVKQIPDVTLYVRSTLGTVTAIDAETGKQKWSSQAGTPGYPSYGVSASDDYLATISGSSLYLLDAETGQVLDTVPARNVPASIPTIDGTLIYLPTTKGLIDVLSTDDLGRLEFTLGSSGRIENSITVSPSTVSWVTSLGHIYVANVGEPGIIYRFQSMDKMVAAPMYANETLIATSLDGFAYAIDEASGDVKWRYSAGGPIREAPLVVDDCAYVTTVDGQMSALNLEAGTAQWLASGVQRFLSVSDTRVYCVTADQRLTVFDKATGGRLGSEPIGEMGFPVVNTNTDRVYLVSKSGALQCLRESGRRWPIARKPPVKQQTDALESTAPGELPGTGTPEPPSAQRETVVDPDDDPFGGLGDDADSPANVDAGSDDAEIPDSGEDLLDPFDLEDDSGIDSGFDDADGGMDDAGDDSDPFSEDF